MMDLRLSDVLRLTDTPSLAFVGAGGKTSALAILAKELPKPVLVTTTTHLGIWQSSIADQHIILDEPSEIKIIENNLNGIILVTQKAHADRLVGLNIENIRAVHELCEKHNLPLIMECDGSRQLAIKAPLQNEPLIPDFVDTVVVVTGLSSLGKPLGEDTVHHPEVFSDLSNLHSRELITKEALARVLVHKQGGLKNIPTRARKIVLLNQADTVLLQSQAGSLAKLLLNVYDGVIVAELQKPIIYGSFEPTAGVILAAGSSVRYGQPKQILDYHGISFITAVIQTAMEAGLDPIVVVTGANAGLVENAVKNKSSRIRIVHNPNWQSGQSTSIRAGIEALCGIDPQYNQDIEQNRSTVYSGNAIFLLADQPQVTSSIIRSLLEYHARTLSPVIAPLVDGSRGNPVLFDRVTFSHLLKLEGDVGGRGIFSNFPPDYIPGMRDPC
jgi:molybdenum cofactor cytidylyltransferase